MKTVNSLVASNSIMLLVFLLSCPSLTIPGFTHSVTEYFLPDVHQMLGGIPTAFSSPPQYKKFKSSYHFAKVLPLNHHKFTGD